MNPTGHKQGRPSNSTSPLLVLGPCPEHVYSEQLPHQFVLRTLGGRMVDPLVSLAFAMHSAKGVYAVLLGSGVSRSARIPTGWEVVLDLIGKVAALSDEACHPD